MSPQGHPVPPHRRRRRGPDRGVVAMLCAVVENTTKVVFRPVEVSTLRCDLQGRFGPPGGGVARVGRHPERPVLR